MSFRCNNIIPTEPGMPSFQCEERTDVPGGMCPDCEFLTHKMAEAGADLIAHKRFVQECEVHGVRQEVTFYVGTRSRPRMHTDN